MLNSRLNKLALALFLLSILLPASLKLDPGLAKAHADYARSEPATGAVVSTAPAEVHVWFTQELFRREGANLLEVIGPDGDQVDQGDSRIDDDNRKHMIVSVRTDLPPGRYIVRWHSLSSEDGHEGNGEFSFTVDSTATETETQASPATEEQLEAEVTTPALVTSPAAPQSPPVSQTPTGLPCLGGFIFMGLGLVFAWPRGCR